MNCIKDRCKYCKAKFIEYDTPIKLGHYTLNGDWAIYCELGERHHISIESEYPLCRKFESLSSGGHYD